MIAGKVVLVTGAAQGIGEAVSRSLAWRGARVGLFSRNAKALQDLERELGYPQTGGRALALPGDVTSLNDLRQASRRLEDVFGPINALVYCANASHSAPVWEIGDESWSQVRAVNLDGAFYATRAVLPSMLSRGQGTIVYISSLAGRRGYPGGSAYAASKRGLLGLADSARQDLRPRGVRVSVVLLGEVSSASGAAGDAWKIQPTDVAETILYVLESDTGVIPATIELQPRRSKPND